MRGPDGSVDWSQGKNGKGQGNARQTRGSRGITTMFGSWAGLTCKLSRLGDCRVDETLVPGWRPAVSQPMDTASTILKSDSWPQMTDGAVAGAG